MATVAKKLNPGKTIKKNVGKDTLNESLAKELKGLIPKLDAEGLAFLVEQARVHLYNMQVDKLNKAAIAAQTASSKAASIRGSSSSKKSGNSKLSGASKSVKEELRITGAESGSSYYLFYRNSNVMFSRSEMTHLVKIVNVPGTDLEIRERLYRWIERERQDIFALVPFANKSDDRLKTISALIKKNFKLRDR